MSPFDYITVSEYIDGTFSIAGLTRDDADDLMDDLGTENSWLVSRGVSNKLRDVLYPKPKER